jgi:hypothetical protein
MGHTPKDENPVAVEVLGDMPDGQIIIENIRKITLSPTPLKGGRREDEGSRKEFRKRGLPSSFK